MTKEDCAIITIQENNHIIIRKGSHEIMAVGVTVHTYDDAHIIHCLKMDGSKDVIKASKMTINAKFSIGSIHLTKRVQSSKTIIDTVAVYKLAKGLLTWSKHHVVRLNNKYTISELSVKGNQT